MEIADPHVLVHNYELSDAEAEYTLHRCAQVASLSKMFFVTRPLVKRCDKPCQRSSMVGVYDQRHESLMSVVSSWPGQYGRICSIAAWRDGVVMCGPEGITYMNATSLITSQLLGVEIGVSGFRCLSDIAVLPSDNSIWFTNTDYSFHDATASKIYCFDPMTGRLHAAASDVEVPINIAFSQNSRKCYVSDAGSASIFVYDVIPASNGAGYTLANRSRFVYIDSVPTVSLKTGSDGSLYAASGKCIFSWSKFGVPQNQYVMQDLVSDFSIQGTTLAVIHPRSIQCVTLGKTELDARL